MSKIKSGFELKVLLQRIVEVLSSDESVRIIFKPIIDSAREYWLGDLDFGRNKDETEFLFSNEWPIGDLSNVISINYAIDYLGTEVNYMANRRIWKNKSTSEPLFSLHIYASNAFGEIDKVSQVIEDWCWDVSDIDQKLRLIIKRSWEE